MFGHVSQTPRLSVRTPGVFARNTPPGNTRCLTDNRGFLSFLNMPMFITLNVFNPPYMKSLFG